MRICDVLLNFFVSVYVTYIQVQADLRRNWTLGRAPNAMDTS